jgi:AcrR family transcriptional regulator
MQYLSQRLAVESTRTRDDQRPRGVLAGPQRERILAAAEQLIAEKGSSGATIEAIVKLAGVSSVTFYEHFEDKEACFVAAFDRAVDETRTKLRATIGDELPWPDRVRAGLRALLAAIAADPARARMCLVEAQRGGAELRARYEAELDNAAAELRQGRALDSAPADLSEALEEATAGGLAWLLREHLELSGGGSLEELLPRMIEIALSPYLGDGGAQPAAAGLTSGDG